MEVEWGEWTKFACWQRLGRKQDNGGYVAASQIGSTILQGPHLDGQICHKNTVLRQETQPDLVIRGRGTLQTDDVLSAHM